VIAYMERYLEFAPNPEQLEIMEAMMEWVGEELPGE
jgi:hypothetical protein